MPDPSIQALQSLWSNRNKGASAGNVDIGGDQMAMPPTPGNFAPEPFVNDTESQQVLHGLLKASPGMAGNIGNVQVGPNAGVSRVMRQSGLTPDQFGSSTLLGLTSPRTQGSGSDIAISPLAASDPATLRNVMAHEMTHAAGYPEAVAYPAGDAYSEVPDYSGTGAHIPRNKAITALQAFSNQLK